MNIEDDAGNVIVVRPGAFIALPNQNKEDEHKNGPRVMHCDVPPLAEVEDFHLDLE